MHEQTKKHSAVKPQNFLTKNWGWMLTLLIGVGSAVYFTIVGCLYIIEKFG